MRLIDADKVIEKITELESEIRLNEYMDKIYRERECLYLEALKKLIEDQKTVKDFSGIIEFTQLEKDWLKCVMSVEFERVTKFGDSGIQMQNRVCEPIDRNMVFRLAEKLGVEI